MSVSKWREKPLITPGVFEAVQWTGRFDAATKHYDLGNASEVAAFVGHRYAAGYEAPGEFCLVFPSAGNFVLRVRPGNYVIERSQAEFYSYTPNTFKEMYEPADAPSKEEELREAVRKYLGSLDAYYSRSGWRADNGAWNGLMRDREALRHLVREQP